MGIHDGHRQRMKKRFMEFGLDSFDDINTLELLLFYAMPRQDTNVLAHKLLAKFGSLCGVMEATAEELQSVDGIGESAAVLLHLIPALTKRYMMQKLPRDEKLLTPNDMGNFFVPRFLYEREEIVLAAMLDARHHVICCRELSRGVVNAAEIRARRLAELALEKKASYVVLAHNHLSGVPDPSAEDERTTRYLSRALELVGVELTDHIIVADCEFVSMRECGMSF